VILRNSLVITLIFLFSFVHFWEPQIYFHLVHMFLYFPFLSGNRNVLLSWKNVSIIRNFSFHIHTCYTGCPGRNVPDFGRMFLKLKYTDITKNTYTRSWTITEIMAREKWSSCGSTYCAWFAWRITRSLRMFVVQSKARSSVFMLWLHM
jgi:hypothetical protein